MKDIDIEFKAFNEIEHLVSDISNKDVSIYGKNAMMTRLINVMGEHRDQLDKVIGYINALEKRTREFEEKIATPMRRENEFKDVAKKLNFPDLSPVADGDVKNPNAEMPFEDPVPENDIERIKFKIDQFADNKIDDIVLTKDEQLTENEISAYTDEKSIAQLAKKELDANASDMTYIVENDVIEKSFRANDVADEKLRKPKRKSKRKTK